MSYAESIRQNRFHEYTVTVGDARTATVKQVDHEFYFGSNIFGMVRGLHHGNLTDYEQAIRKVWNFGTLPFYWGRYEPVEGEPDEENVMRAARWARDKGLTTKGHPLCWHTVCADWLLQYDNDTILKKQLDRITRDVSLYAGVIDMWDVINEVVIMPRFNKYDNAVTRICNHVGPVELTLQVFRAAREANPDAILLINDFDLSNDYKALITELLDRGCPIDVIGLQSHQHSGYDGADYTLEVIDRFAGFGKPLHFTETTILSGHPVPPDLDDLNDYQVAEWPSTPDDEERQAEQVAEYYSVIFSRPETAALVWWDLQDGNWLNAPAGLLRRDLSPKPAFERVTRLIKDEWWFAEQELPTASDGAIHFTGAAGRYQIASGGRTTTVSLGASNRKATLE
jgi:endo-1,4-beta-xylanase